MEKEGYRIFKITFLSLAAGISVGMFVYFAITAAFSDEHFGFDHYLKLFLKSFAVGIITALILAAINGFFKLFPMKSKE